MKSPSVTKIHSKLEHIGVYFLFVGVSSSSKILPHFLKGEKVLGERDETLVQDLIPDQQGGTCCSTEETGDGLCALD